MENCKYRNKLLIIGATPESAGVGGVTIHVERLIQYLNKVKFPYNLYNYKREPWYGVFGAIYRSEVVHLHICNPYYMLFVVTACTLFRKQILLTLHGKYVKNEQRLWPLIQYAVKIATVPIVLNQASYDTCIGINSRTILIPAFIPPQKNDSLAKDVTDIVESIRAQGKRIAVTYGFDDQMDVKGREVYGVSFLLPLFNDNVKYSLIVSNPSGCYKRKYAKKYPNVYFINHPLSLYELLKLADVFVRNTSKDGDSLSVKEALYLGKKVICTDVVERPEGALLFSYSDEKSFIHCLNTIIDPERGTIVSGEKKLLELYKKLV